jgi:hypothetical protein
MSAATGSAVRHPARGRRIDDRSAGRLALAGAALGLVAGALELTIGPSIRDWVGDKQDTTRLGLTTILLSAVALAAATALQRRQQDTGGRRVAIALGLVLPALVCFTTVGRLWYIPGALLLASAALTVAATPRTELTAALTERHWRLGLLAVCGALYVFLGATTLGVAGVLGVLGGLLVWAAARAAPRTPRTAHALLLAGALPFAAATWWSVITPVIAVLTLVVGHRVIRHASTDRKTP